MTLTATAAARNAAPALPLPTLRPEPADAMIQAAGAILVHLEKGRPVDRHTLRAAAEAAFGVSDAEGGWGWKDAYEACEAAQLLFLRKYGRVMLARGGGDALAMLERIAALVPAHTRRSEESQSFQQFSTPIELGFVAARAAGLVATDLVLEPSAGTGLLAVFAEIAGAELALNELAPTRAALLGRLFPGVAVTRHDAETIHDRLDRAVQPTVILLNPPFSASPNVEGRALGAALKHLASALARLEPGGRLVAITGANVGPDRPAWADAFRRLQEDGAAVRFSAAVDGHVYTRHGTGAATRLTVIDRTPAADPALFPAALPMAESVAALLALVERHVPPRAGAAAAAPSSAPVPVGTALVAARRPAPIVVPARAPLLRLDPPKPRLDIAEAVELAYETRDWTPPAGQLGAALYEPYSVQSIELADAQPHPTRLVQSAAMASVAPPPPSYRPHLPSRLAAEGRLSDAQLESVVYAGEAHAGHLAGAWTVDATFDRVAAAADDAEGAVRFRRGWFLGDGTGAGKGRQVAGIVLDNWLKGRRRALWLSKSDKLLEDAQRDWTALGGERWQIVPLSRFRQGAPIELAEGILFLTYATLRSPERDGRASRLRQVVDWLGEEFDGVVVFDEAHAMANAAGSGGERGDKAPSQQGRAGLRLQHALPDARVVYVSATGATTVHNLAYAQRLGLWGGADFPFSTRAEFVSAMEAGGIAAMEVLARDLKSLGLYAARSLSYEGVEYEMLEHRLTPEQVRIYDAYAGAFQVIHANLNAALEALNITGKGPDGGDRTHNAQAKSAARSAFESNKQRFFNHLICAMKAPTLIASIEADLAAGHAAVVQIVSTGEALLDRRLAEIPASEWGDVSVDITPREYVLDYLAHSFPTQLHELYSDDEGNVLSRPVFDARGNPVASRDAEARRDRLIEHLASLAPVQGALDQIVHRFGTDAVAEVTGRSRRIAPVVGDDGEVRLAVQSRPGSANLAETQAFMDDVKRVIVFSDAGGTGRSYHADLGAKNQRLRVHYLVEPGWRADNAIQGLGRSNRTNQAQPPLFRPVSTDVKGEKRFLSTIARRLDTLGAITKGQRQTGGQGLFRADDNLESEYARAALRQFYRLVVSGKVEGCSLTAFQDATGLELCDRDGTMKEELPPITQWLNRMLALTIALQNRLFEVFEELLDAQVEGAVAAGLFDVGVETLAAESLTVAERRTVFRHPATSAETSCVRVARVERNRWLARDEALELAREHGGALLVNAQSGRAAVQVRGPSATLDDGTVEPRVRLVRPVGRETFSVEELGRSHWKPTDAGRFAAAWDAEISTLPETTTSEMHLVTGLLLPIWDRLPGRDLRVYRLQTDDGERMIGRLIAPEALDGLYRSLGVEGAPSLGPAEAFAAVLTRGATLHLAGGLQVRRATVMHRQRVELVGVSDGAVERLKAMGCLSEIIAWKLRLFVPVDARGPDILAKIAERHPIARVVQAATTAAA